MAGSWALEGGRGQRKTGETLVSPVLSGSQDQP
jgi:hypothetical protein